MNRWFIIFLLFAFSILLRLFSLNAMGRVWDEHFFVNQGYEMIDLLARGDFKDRLWYQDPDPPPLSKYLYGIAEHLKPSYYDFTFPRIVSVVLSSSTVVIVILIGWRYISFSVGVFSGIILAMIPFFLGLSQLATIESPLMFFFTTSVYSFLRFLENFSLKFMFLTGILIGLSMLTKFTNILLIPLFFSIYTLWFFYKKKSFRNNLIKIMFMFVVSIFTIFLLWPMPWFHIGELAKYMYNLRVTTNLLPVPEVFFGKLILVPKIYYWIHFIITTPLIILILFCFGLKKISNAVSKNANKREKLILLALVIWFFLPFVQSFYNFRQHGIRYIIEIYAPLSLISGIGVHYFLKNHIKSRLSKIIVSILLIFYMLAILWRINPYYLDYFNELVGGTKNVYEKRLFQLGWWGQGIREAVEYLKRSAPTGSKIGLALSPDHTLPPLPNFFVEKYNFKKKYDFVVVNHYNVIREGFDDAKIRNEYSLIFTVDADGAKLVSVYKFRQHKQKI